MLCSVRRVCYLATGRLVSQSESDNVVHNFPDNIFEKDKTVKLYVENKQACNSVLHIDSRQ
jgi:hypothetical protein